MKALGLAPERPVRSLGLGIAAATFCSFASGVVASGTGGLRSIGAFVLCVIVTAIAFRACLRILDAVGTARAAEARSKMARRLSHDLRSPLSALSLLDGEALHAASSEHAQLFRLSLARITSLADELLNMNRMSSDETAIGWTLDNPPAWLLPKLRLRPEGRIVVMDDDPSMLAFWRKKLSGRDAVFLQDPGELSLETFPPDRCVYLLDHEIPGSAVTGLDLIRRFSLGERAVLVTSYFSDKTVQAGVLEAGAYLLPKFLAAQVELG